MALSLLPDKSILKGIDVFKYIVSPDIKYLLLMHNITFAGINSFEAYYELLDREKRTRRPVVGACGARLLQKTTWAPRGGAFAFVQGNDLFYVANAAAAELRPLRLTNTGVPDRVYNGLPCFSYDKVVFWSRPAMWFSPDGRYLAWASFDDTAVGTVMLPFYFPSRSLYADNLTIRYPLTTTSENSGSTSGSSNGEDGGDGGGGGNGRNNGSSGGDSGAGDSGGSGGSGGIRVAMSWESQAPLRARIAATVLPWEMRAELPLRHGRRARLRLWLPPNYDVAKAKYPLLLDMNEEWDGGPRASERFTVDWRAHLAANRSVVYAVVAAGAGPPHKGIGQDDVDDQLHAIRELVERFNYIDAARVGVWGWSRGGYLAAMTMARDAAKLVRCAIAVAPVVNWHYYNALYTERYLHLPDDNAAGYARADLSQHAEGLRGKRLLLAHGSLDSLVHLRHSLALAMELHDLDVPFDFQLYPDEEHALSGVKSHLFRKMERFLEECFPLD